MIKKAYFAAIVFMASAPFVFAQINPDPPTSPIQSPDDIYDLAVNISSWLYRIFFVIAVLYILLAAYQYLTARDDAAQVKKAQASLRNAVIAIVVALISTGLAALINQVLKI